MKEVQISSPGILNGAAVSGKDKAISSSAVAVAAPTGMIMEQDAQPGNVDQLSDPQAEALTVTVRSGPSQTTTANMETQSTSSLTQVTCNLSGCLKAIVVVSNLNFLSGKIADQFLSVKSFG